MKKFSSVFSCFHTDIMNKYIFPVQQKISGKFPGNFPKHIFPEKLHHYTLHYIKIRVTVGYPISYRWSPCVVTCGVPQCTPTRSHSSILAVPFCWRIRRLKNVFGFAGFSYFFLFLDSNRSYSTRHLSRPKPHLTSISSHRFGIMRGHMRT